MHRSEGSEPAGDAPIEREILDALRTPVAAPDLTRTIMGRLGYMRTSAGAVRRRRLRRASGRALILAIAAASGALAIFAVEYGPLALVEPGPTIPAAIGRDVERHHQQLERTIRSIQRTIAPARLAPTRDVDRIDDDVDRSAIGPVRWI